MYREKNTYTGHTQIHTQIYIQRDKHIQIDTHSDTHRQIHTYQERNTYTQDRHRH